MITAIRNNNFSNYRCSNNTQQHNINNNFITHSAMTDSVSFSGNLAKLSEHSSELVQQFAKKLELNKLYKFDTPNVERFQIASVASPKEPSTRNLFIQYSSYSKDNSARYMMFSINNLGEVFENGEKIKYQKDVNLYEILLPKLINKASKELRIKVS